MHCNETKKKKKERKKISKVSEHTDLILNKQAR